MWWTRKRNYGLSETLTSGLPFLSAVVLTCYKSISAAMPVLLTPPPGHGLIHAEKQGDVTGFLLMPYCSRSKQNTRTAGRLSFCFELLEGLTLKTGFSDTSCLLIIILPEL